MIQKWQRRERDTEIKQTDERERLREREKERAAKRRQMSTFSVLSN